jgi:hypothetical protein
LGCGREKEGRSQATTVLSVEILNNETVAVALEHSSRELAMLILGSSGDGSWRVLGARPARSVASTSQLDLEQGIRAQIRSALGSTLEPM